MVSLVSRSGSLRGISALARSALQTAGAVFALWLTLTSASTGEVVWYQPSNGNQGGKALPDFLQLFDPAANKWPSAQREASVLLLSFGSLRNAEQENPDFFRSTLSPFLARTGMKLAINSGLATFASCRELSENNQRLEHRLKVMRRMMDAGVKISFISLQSTLSKLYNRRTQCPGYSLERRIDDIIWYISSVREGLNVHDDSLQFGLIDASLTKGEAFVQTQLGVSRIEEAYSQLFAALEKRGLRISYVHLDYPWERFGEFNRKRKGSFGEIHNFQAWLEERQVASGLFLTSVRSATEKEFHDRVLQVLGGYVHGGAATRHVVLASWKKIPTTELPESPEDPNRYPMTRVLKDIGIFLRGRDRVPAVESPKTLQ